MATDKLSYALLKQSASKAHKKAKLDGIERPLSYWQEFLSQSLGWASFHQACIELNSPIEGSLSIPDIKPTLAGFPCQTLKDVERLFQALPLFTSSFDYSGPKSYAFEAGKHVLLHALESNQEYFSLLRSHPGKFLNTVFSTLPEANGSLKASANLNSISIQSLSNFFWIVDHSVKADNPSLYGTQAAVDLLLNTPTFFVQLTSPWMDSIRTLETLLSFNPTLSFYIPSISGHANPRSMMSVQFFDQGWSTHDGIAYFINSQCSKKAYATQDFLLSDLVKEQQNPFISDHDRLKITDSVRHLLKAASLEQLQELSNSWKVEALEEASRRENTHN